MKFINILYFCLFAFSCFSQKENKEPKILYLSRECPNDDRINKKTLCLNDTACTSKKIISEDVDNEPAVSNKKDKIAYLKTDRQLFIADINGDNQKLIYDCSPGLGLRKWSNVVISSPVWSPDDSKLLFNKRTIERQLDRRHLEKRMLCIVDLKTNIIDSFEVDGGIREIYWIKDMLLVYRKDCLKPGITSSMRLNDFYTRLYSFNLKTKEEKALTDPLISIAGNDLSAKTNKIVFNAYPQRQLFIANFDGTDKKQITYIQYPDTLNNGTGIGLPVFSPDGKKIAFAIKIKREVNIAVMNSDGSDLNIITKDKNLWQYGPSQIEWTKDGEWLILREQLSCNFGKLSMISIDGKTIKELKNASCINFSFIWMD